GYRHYRHQRPRTQGGAPRIQGQGDGCPGPRTSEEVTTKHQLEAPYTLRSIREMLGLSRAVLAGFIDAGFVQPSRGPRNEYRFTFQDVVLLRTAQGLHAASIPPRKILRSLKRLKAALPRELPL